MAVEPVGGAIGQSLRKRRVINSKGSEWDVSCILSCTSSRIRRLHDSLTPNSSIRELHVSKCWMTHVVYSRRLHFGQSARARALRVGNSTVGASRTIVGDFQYNIVLQPLVAVA